MSSSVGERWTGSQPLTVVDPGRVRGEGDDQQAGMGLGLGEGGVVAAGAADQRAAGAAAAGRQQVAVAFAVEVGRARQAADQAVGAVAAVELVRARAGLDQVVLGAGFDRVVAEAAGEADAADRLAAILRPGGCRCRGRGRPSASAPGRSAGQETGCGSLPGRASSRGRSPAPFARVTLKVWLGFVEGDDELVAAAAADDLQPGAAAGGRVELDVGGGFRRRFLAAGGRCGLWRPRSRRCPGRRRACRGRRRRRGGRRRGRRRSRCACGLPIRVSRKAEPSRLSKPKSLSWPSPQARCGLQRGPDAAALAAGARGREGGDVAVAGAAGHAVVAVVAVDEVFVAGAAVDDVDAEVAGDLVAVARPAEDLVVAEVAVDLVARRRRRRRPRRCRGRRGSGRSPGPPQIRSLPRLPKIDVVALAAPDHVALRRPADHVVAVGADDLRLPAVAARTSSSSLSRRGRRPTAKAARRQQPEQTMTPLDVDSRRTLASVDVIARLRRCGSASC